MTQRSMVQNVFDSKKIKDLALLAAGYGQDYINESRAIGKVLLEPLSGRGIVSTYGLGPTMAYACAQAGAGDKNTANRIVDLINDELGKVGIPQMNRRASGILANHLINFAVKFTPGEIESIGLVSQATLQKNDQDKRQMTGVYIVTIRHPLLFDITRQVNSPAFRRNIEFEGEIEKAEFSIALENGGRNSPIYRLAVMTKFNSREVSRFDWTRALIEARDYSLGRAEVGGAHLPEGFIGIETTLPETLRLFVATNHFKGLLRNGVLVLGNFDTPGGIFEKPVENLDTYWLY